MKYLMAFCVGAVLSWLITADHYGMILRSIPASGIMCRVHGMDAILVGTIIGPDTVCADLSYATPEEDLWQDFWHNVRKNWSYPQ